MSKTYIEIRKNVINIFLTNEKGKNGSFIKLRLMHLEKPFDGGIY